MVHIIFQTLGLEPQINVMSSNSNNLFSNSMWSVFETLYRDHHSVSECTSSSQSSSYMSMLDDTQYITTAKADDVLSGPNLCVSDDATWVQIDSSLF